MDDDYGDSGEVYDRGKVDNDDYGEACDDVVTSTVCLICLSSLILQDKCLDSCATKLIRSNHRLMAAYVGLMPAVVQRRMDDMEKQSKELEAMAESKPDLSLGANPESVVPVEAAGVTDHVTSTSESP